MSWLEVFRLYGQKNYSPQAWKQIRAKGKARFVFLSALAWGVFMTGTLHIVSSVFDGPQSLYPLKVIIFLISGIPVGMTAWSTQEKKYQKALREARVNALPNNHSSLSRQSASNP